MKRRWGKTLLITGICSILAVSMTSYAADTFEDELSKINPSGWAALDYQAAYNPVFDELDVDNEYGWFYLWDINNSGTAEIIIGHGESPETYVNDIWGVNENGKAVYIGSFNSLYELYKNPDGTGIVAVSKRLEDGASIRITIEDGELITIKMKDSELDPDVYNIDSEYSLIEADIRNRGPLEMWSIPDTKYFDVF